MRTNVNIGITIIILLTISCHVQIIESTKVFTDISPTIMLTPSFSMTINSTNTVNSIFTKENPTKTFADSTESPFSFCKRNYYSSINNQISPDGLWCIYSTGDEIVAISKDGNEWLYPIIEKNKIILEEYDAISFHVFIENWSKDSKLVYFTWEAMWDPGIKIYGSTTALWEMNLINGVVRELIPWNNWKDIYSASISPLEQTLIYINQLEYPLSINIIELLREKKYTILIDKAYHAGGEYLWSPNGIYVIIELAGPIDLERDSDEDYDYYSYALVNLNNREYYIFINKLSHKVKFIEITNDYAIYIDANSNQYKLNYQDKTIKIIKEVTPTI